MKEIYGKLSAVLRAVIEKRCLSVQKITLPHDHNERIDEICENMPDAEQLQTVSDIFKQLSDTSRIRIFWLLCHCEECVINISAITNMSSPAVSHHLKQLKAYKLIVSRRDGKEVYYKASETEQAALLHSTLEQLMNIVCPSGNTEEL